ncbi:MAG: helix-turn-helix domain-containing protein [Candidatus Kapabacteria bacterium]|nr:helix-turn-helix domain-containing protein [Candidatus Kapabacteria bacterium]
MKTNTKAFQDGTSASTEIELLTPYQYGEVLKVAGFSQSELARFTGKSRSYVNNVANSVTPIRLRHVQELERFLGSRLYSTATIVVKRIEQEEAEKRHKETLRAEEHRRKQEKQREQAELDRRQKRAEELTSALESYDANESNEDIDPVDI